jgi:hypothetical protein
MLAKAIGFAIIAAATFSAFDAEAQQRARRWTFEDCSAKCDRCGRSNPNCVQQFCPPFPRLASLPAAERKLARRAFTCPRS